VEKLVDCVLAVIAGVLMGLLLEAFVAFVVWAVREYIRSENDKRNR
jgi:hypothetical protein